MTELQKIISKAYEKLPIEKRAKPWTFVNHGVGLLKNDDELNCYLVAYGRMHEEKIHSALSTFTNIEEITRNNYQIFDWGCGQGLATLCFFDFINNRTTNQKPQKITLIEPSNAAITKAKEYIQSKYGNNYIVLIEKKLNDVNLSDINITEPITINFFSNILDIETVDLEKLTKLIKSNLKGEQYFICVGPMNVTSTRIDTFAKLFNCSEKQLIGKENGNLKTTRGTIKLLVFKIEGTEIKIIKSIYYPPMPKNNNITHILEKKLKAIDSNKLNSFDRIIEYYKLVVELEQLKEPAIDNYYPYNYTLNDSNDFVIDLESNKSFLEVFNQNKKEKWPKDLNIALDVDIDGKKYPILNYTYLFDDVKDIDTLKEKVKLQLLSFEVNYSILTSKFEKNEAEIDELENLVKQQFSIEEVIKVLKNKLDTNLTFDNKLSFALSSKNPALNQIYSELRGVNSLSVSEKSLLSSFLFNKSIDNKLNNYSENDIIQISNLDDSQKNAVLTALNNKVSVITGPPGSGKTQVISNILANAVLQNKKILVASKNNQAVDNVKSRFDREESLGFFLRFGNKKILCDTTLPEINRISALKATLSDNSDKVYETTEKLKQITKTKSESKEKLKQRDLLKSKLFEIKDNIEKIKAQLLQLIQRNSDFENLRLNHRSEDFENFISETKKKRNQFDLKYSGLNRLWIDWFKKNKHAFELINFIDDTHKDFKDIFKSLPNQISDFKNGIQISETYNEIIKIFNSVIEYCTNYSKIENELKLKSEELNKVENYISVINSQEQEILQLIHNCEIEIIGQSKIALKEKIENKLFNASQPQINNYKDYLPDNIPWKNEEKAKFENATKNFLDVFNIISVTSLSAKTALPLSNELFDIVIIDEASQCDIASAIPLIFRAKQLVVIGDPLQLKHITSLNKYEEDRIKEHLLISGSIYLKYKEKSLWDYSETFVTNANNNNKVVNIDRHYRCHPDIIGYSNEAFYNPKLGVDLKVCTERESFKIKPSGIKWIDIIGTQSANNVNVNDAEVLKSIEIATYFANKYPDITIGIVTPFTQQAKEIYSKIPVNFHQRIVADTVHKFQGDEKDIMIYSLVVTNNSPDKKIHWIDNMVPESVNVAITRARNTIYIVGNKEYIRSKSNILKPLGKLVDYIEKLPS